MNAKNVINLGIVSNDTLIPKGIVNRYYIYYKADGDLYFYSSEDDVELDLFKLGRNTQGVEIPISIGHVIVNAFKQLMGFVKITVNRYNIGHVVVSASRYAMGHVKIDTSKYSKGNVTITAKKL